ncbi:MAG: cyclic nucleotide-binding domain-containing protein [Sulfuriferula sp.]|nr:cyclic nucleotide-binding domain-containing protein [Sulfuriferula sp.]
MKFELENLFHHESDLCGVPADQTLFSEGDTGDVMYVLMSGTANILVNGKVVEQAVRGTMLGEMSVIEDGALRSATVVTTSECKFVPVDQARFKFLIQNTPNFGIHVMRVIANRLRCTNKLI